jgi:hypothetical protein
MPFCGIFVVVIGGGCSDLLYASAVLANCVELFFHKFFCVIMDYDFRLSICLNIGD